MDYKIFMARVQQKALELHSLLKDEYDYISAEDERAIRNLSDLIELLDMKVHECSEVLNREVDEYKLYDTTLDYK